MQFHPERSRTSVGPVIWSAVAVDDTLRLLCVDSRLTGTATYPSHPVSPLPPPAQGSEEGEECVVLA